MISIYCSNHVTGQQQDDVNSSSAIQSTTTARQSSTGWFSWLFPSSNPIPTTTTITEEPLRILADGKEQQENFNQKLNQ